MEPLPEVFFKVELNKLIKEIKAPIELKQKLYADMLHHCVDGSTARQAVKSSHTILYGVNWSWPRGKKQLKSEGADTDSDELLELFFSKVLFSGYALYRQSQIRTVLKQQMGHLIQVIVDGQDVAPCGIKHLQAINPDEDPMKFAPPCDSLRCACRWVLARPGHLIKGSGA